MFIVYVLLSLLIIVCSLAICYIIFYNNLQHNITKVDQAESIIDERLRNKYDLLVEITTIVEKVVPDQKKVFSDVAKLKEENISNFDLDRKLTDIVILLKKFNSDYKELNENKDFKKIMKDINAVDERIQAAKSFYNKYTSLSNDLIRKFPSNIIAKMHNMQIRLFFDGKDMHDNILDDFKF